MRITSTVIVPPSLEFLFGVVVNIFKNFNNIELHIRKTKIIWCYRNIQVPLFQLRILYARLMQVRFSVFFGYVGLNRNKHNVF